MQVEENKRCTQQDHAHQQNSFPPRGDYDGKEEKNKTTTKKKTSSWTYFLRILIPVNLRKTGQCLMYEVCLRYRNFKVELLLLLRVERGDSGMIRPWTDLRRVDETMFLGRQGERLESPLEEMGGGMGLPTRDQDPYQRLKDEKRPHEIPGFSLS